MVGNERSEPSGRSWAKLWEGDSLWMGLTASLFPLAALLIGFSFSLFFFWCVFFFFISSGYQHVGLRAGGNSRSSFIGGEEESQLHTEGQGVMGCALCLENMVPWSHFTFFPSPKAVGPWGKTRHRSVSRLRLWAAMVASPLASHSS